MRPPTQASEGRGRPRRWRSLTAPAEGPESRSIRAPTADDDPDRPQQDLQIQPERNVAHVFAVVLHPLFEADLGTAADLPKAGQPGLDAQADGVARPVLLDLARQRRPWSNQAHLPLEDVDQLRQLVEARPAEERADLADPWIVTHLEDRSIGLVVGQDFSQALLGVRVHRAELVEAEMAPVEAHAFLNEDCPPG